jgi:hypothetical protein
MWKSVMASLRPGQRLLTPGRGIPVNRQRHFLIRGMTGTSTESIRRSANRGREHEFSG